jgi:N-acetylneuraminic acid mutarotase
MANRAFALFYFASPLLYANALNVPDLPEPVTNNSVAQVTNSRGTWWVSFMGLGKSKDYRDVYNRVFAWHLGDKAWTEKSPVPASTQLKGRLAATAVGVGEHAYVFGGYTVAADHSEISSPDNYRYDVLLDKYEKLANMPVPVDDSVALVFQNRYIYLISGWHNDGNVNLVQVYDIQTDSWQQASPFPGRPVFGHSGAISGNNLVICDGVGVDYYPSKRRGFSTVAACFTGEIQADAPHRINWNTLHHPSGKGRYRMAAGAKDNLVYFIGGATNAYNYNGIGYDGVPSTPSNKVWIFDIQSKSWSASHSSVPTMDHRGLLFHEERGYVIGGMAHDQKVLKSINSFVTAN